MFRKKSKNKTHQTLVTQEHNQSQISEQFKSIRSNLLFSSIDQKIQAFVITSDKPEAGKSTIAANLAVAYAQAGYQTLLVDGDMRKPTQHLIFDVEKQYGLSSLITHHCPFNQAIKKSEEKGLDILTAGPTPPNPSELIVSQRFHHIFSSLTEWYDFIIIDTPPVNSVTDAQIFAQIAGNAVLVVDSEDNNKREVKKAKMLIENSGAQILGVILNKVEVEKSNYY